MKTLVFDGFLKNAGKKVPFYSETKQCLCIEGSIQANFAISLFSTLYSHITIPLFPACPKLSTSLYKL